MAEQTDDLRGQFLSGLDQYGVVLPPTQKPPQETPQAPQEAPKAQALTPTPEQPQGATTPSREAFLGGLEQFGIVPPKPQTPQPPPPQAGAPQVQPPAQEAIAPLPQPEEKPLWRQAVEEGGRISAAANRQGFLPMVDYLARGVEHLMSVPKRAVASAFGLEGAKLGDTDWSNTPHVLTKLIGGLMDFASPKEIGEPQTKVGQFLAPIIGGLQAYGGSGKMVGGAQTFGKAAMAGEGAKAAVRVAGQVGEVGEATVLKELAEMGKKPTLVQNLITALGHNLVSFGVTDVAHAIHRGEGEDGAMKALKASVPNAALFAVASVLPFDRITKNPWMVASLQSAATGTAFSATSAIGGEREPEALAVHFLTGFFLHAMNAGPQAYKQSQAIKSWKAQKEAALKDFERYLKEFEEAYNLSKEETEQVRSIVDLVANPPQPDRLHPEGERGAVPAGDLAKHEGLTKEFVTRGLTPEQRRPAVPEGGFTDVGEMLAQAKKQEETRGIVGESPPEAALPGATGEAIRFQGEMAPGTREEIIKDATWGQGGRGLSLSQSLEQMADRLQEAGDPVLSYRLQKIIKDHGRAMDAAEFDPEFKDLEATIRKSLYLWENKENPEDVRQMVYMLEDNSGRFDKYKGGAGKVIGEEPSAKPILNQYGEELPRADVLAALRKPAYERNAHEKMLADEAERQGWSAERVSASMGLKEEPSAPGAIVTPKVESKGPAEKGESAFVALKRAADVSGNPQLNNLLRFNEGEIVNAFRAPADTPGLPEITNRITELARRLEDTGDPNVARELSRYIESNLGALKGYPRWPAVGEREPGLPKEPEKPEVKLPEGPMGSSGGTALDLAGGKIEPATPPEKAQAPMSSSGSTAKDLATATEPEKAEVPEHLKPFTITATKGRRTIEEGAFVEVSTANGRTVKIYRDRDSGTWRIDMLDYDLTPLGWDSPGKDFVGFDKEDALERLPEQLHYLERFYRPYRPPDAIAPEAPKEGENVSYLKGQKRDAKTLLDDEANWKKFYGDNWKQEALMAIKRSLGGGPKEPIPRLIELEALGKWQTAAKEREAAQEILGVEEPKKAPKGMERVSGVEGNYVFQEKPIDPTKIKEGPLADPWLKRIFDNLKSMVYFNEKGEPHINTEDANALADAIRDGDLGRAYEIARDTQLLSDADIEKLRQDAVEKNPEARKLGDVYTDSEGFSAVHGTELRFGDPETAKKVGDRLKKYHSAEITGELEKYRIEDLTIEERIEAFKESPLWADMTPDQQNILIRGNRPEEWHPALVQFVQEMTQPGMVRGMSRDMALYPPDYLNKIQRLYRATREAMIGQELSTDLITKRMGGFGEVYALDRESLKEEHERGWVAFTKNQQMLFIYESKFGELSVAFDRVLDSDWAELGRQTDRKVGSQKAWSFGSVLEFAKGQGARTLDHELFHHIVRWLLTPKERAQLVRFFGPNEEVWSEAYAHWEPKAAPNTAFQKILDFFQNIVKWMTGFNRVEDIFAKSRTGEMFGRAASLEAAPRITIDSQGKIQAVGEGIRAGMSTYSENPQEFIDLAAKYGKVTREEAEKFVQDANHVFHWMIETPETHFVWNKQFSSVKNNSDFYKFSEDYSTLCNKIGFTLATVDAIQAKLGRFLTPEELLKVRLDLHSAGYQVGCGACYRQTSLESIATAGNKFMEMWRQVQPGVKVTDLDGYFYTSRATAEMKERGEKAPYDLVDYINKHGKPDIPEEWFLTSYGYSLLVEKYPEIAKTFREKVFGGSHAKPWETHTEYNREYIQRNESGNYIISDKEIERMNRRGGSRSQSWSDFFMQHALDKMQSTFDKALRAMLGHSYTKVKEYVLLMGLTGEKINMSLIPTEGNGINPVTGEFTIHPTESFQWKDAMELRERFRDSAGTVMLGVTDEHIRKAMEDQRIDYIIPFHASGRAKGLWAQYGMEGWADYTNEQHYLDVGDVRRSMIPHVSAAGAEYKFMSWDDLAKGAKTPEQVVENFLQANKEKGLEVKYPKARAMSLGVAADEARIPAWKDFAKDCKTPQEVVDNFMAACKAENIIPPFVRFAARPDGTWNPNYLKLITDVKFMHNGELLPPQRPLQPIFDQKVLNEMMRGFVENPTPLSEKPVNSVVEKFLNDSGEGAKLTPEAVGQALPEEIAPTKERRAGARDVDMDRAEKEGRREQGLPTFSEFKGWLFGENGLQWKRLSRPGATEIPLYEGEAFTPRAGNQIMTKKGIVNLTPKQVYERFLDPQEPYAEGAKRLDPRMTVPEGTVMPPPDQGKLSGIREKWRQIRFSAQAKLSVDSISRIANEAHQAMKEYMGWGAREMAKAKAVLDRFQDTLGTLRGDDLWRFTDLAESGDPAMLAQLSPELRQAAEAWRRLSDGFHYLVADVKGGEFSYWTDYFPRLCENPQLASEAIRNWFAIHGGEGRGGPGFLKSRVMLRTSDLFRPVEEGGLGLKPKFDNYVEAMKANLWEKTRWLQDNYIKGAMEDAGFIMKQSQPLKEGEPQPTRPPGWVELPSQGIWKGYWAPPDIAAVVDKHLSPGLRGDPLYKLYYDPFHYMNEVFVGFSAFHASFSTLSLFSHGVGMNVPRMIGSLITGNMDNFKFHARQLAKTFNIRSVWQESGRLAEQYASPGAHPELETMVDLMTRGGVRIQMESYKELRRGISEAISESWANLPRQVIKAIAWPIMGQLVPRFKLAAGMLRLQNELRYATEKARGEGRELTRNEMTELAQQVMREEDNIFGQMVYDNLGMKKGVKDALAMWIGFPGWNLGSFKIMKDAMQGFSHMITEPARMGKEAIMGKEVKYREMSREHRQGLEFFIGMTMVMAVGGAIINRLLTGEWPTSAKDLFMPRTGGTLANGQPERVRMPTYMRDVLSLNHPVDMIAHKQAFPLRMFQALTANQDYFGEQIRDPYASGKEQTLQTAEYLGKSLLPFGIQGMLKSQTPQSKALNVVGITPVPRQYSNTEAQNVIDDYNRMVRATTTSKETGELKKLKSDLMKLAREGDQDGFKAAAEDAVQEGKITRQQVKELIKESQVPANVSRFSHLPLEWAMRALDVASPEEAEAWTPYFLKKVMAEKPEKLIRYKDHLVATLDRMGLTDASQAVQGLDMPEGSVGEDLSSLGVVKPMPEMGDMMTVDQAIAQEMAKKFEEKKKPRTSPPSASPGKKKKSNPFEVLGL